MIKRALMLPALLVLISQAAHGAFILTEAGSGSVTLSGSNGSVSFAALTVDRTNPEFGNHTTAVEGVYYTYTFTAPSVDNAEGKSNFDVQNNMDGLWSGWGDARNGSWQYGPTTGTWNRGNRRQHGYLGGTATSTFVSIPPGPDLNVPLNATLNEPEYGDVLKASVYLNAVDNTVLTVYENVTKGESFEYLTTDPDLPSGNMSFDRIAFRSDASVAEFDYTYGTLVVAVPEPSTFVIAAFGLLGLIGFGRRRKR